MRGLSYRIEERIKWQLNVHIAVQRHTVTAALPARMAFINTTMTKSAASTAGQRLTATAVSRLPHGSISTATAGINVSIAVPPIQAWAASTAPQAATKNKLNLSREK
jgi:hypothetical protein